MRRRIAIALLSLGTFGGFAAGFASLHHHHRGWHCHSSARGAECGNGAHDGDERGPRGEGPRGDDPR